MTVEPVFALIAAHSLGDRASETEIAIVSVVSVLNMAWEVSELYKLAFAVETVAVIVAVKPVSWNFDAMAFKSVMS